MRRTIEDVLEESGALDEKKLRQCRHHARQNGVCLVRAVVEHGGVSAESVAETLTARLGLPSVDLGSEVVDDEAVRLVPYDLAESRRILPLSVDRARRRIRIAMADPLDFDATEEIEIATGLRVEPLIGRVDEIGDAVIRYYRGVITKMIPRGNEPVTQPYHQIADDAPPDMMVRALVDVLTDRGVIDRDAWTQAILKRMKENAGE
jgi:hypothetical protein